MAFFGQAPILVERPGLGRTVHRQRPGGALLGAERAVDALARDLNGLAVVARLDRPGHGGSGRRGGRGGGGLGRGLLRRGLEEGAGDEQVLLLGGDHVVVARQLDRLFMAEIGAVAAEGAGAEVEDAGDLLAALDGDGLGLDRAAGAHALAHAAVDALFGVEDDPAAIAGRGLAGHEGVHFAARLGKQAFDGFFYKRKIHYFCPLFSLRIWVASARPSMTA